MQPFRAHQLAHQAEEFPTLSESTTYVRIGPLPTGQDVLTEAIEAEVPPGSGPTQAHHAALFFTADMITGFRQLWQSDGTVLVSDFRSQSLTNVNGKLFFSSNDGVHGQELWVLVDGPTLDVRGFPATVTAGSSGSFIVTVKKADGGIKTSYRGTVHFTSTDPQAVLPADYTFTGADGGVHTFSATLKTAGNQSITTSDSAVPSSAVTQSGIAVTAAASRFTVTGFPSPVTAGVAGSFTVTASDA
jgi:hypothetical protein